MKEKQKKKERENEKIQNKWREEESAQEHEMKRQHSPCRLVNKHMLMIWLSIYK